MACIVSHTTISGVGIIQTAVTMQLKRIAMPDTPSTPHGSSSSATEIAPVQPINGPLDGSPAADTSTAATTALSGAALPEPLRSRLAGRWLCTRLEGDCARQLELLGVSWMQRKAAAALNYGVGQGTAGMQTISINGIRVTIRALNGSFMFTVDGSEQSLPLPGESRPARATVGLDGSVIDIRVPAKEVHMRRWVEGDSMVVLIDVKGVTTHRYFSMVV